MRLQDPVHRAMRPLPHHLAPRPGLLRRRLEPSILPQSPQQLAQPDLHPRRRPLALEMSDRLLRLDHLAPGDHLPRDVLEQLLAGDLLPLPPHARGDFPAHHLDQVIGVPHSLEQECTLSPLGAPWSDGPGSPRSCDNDGSWVLEPACFSAKIPGNEWEIPAITIILTGIIGRVSNATSPSSSGV
jgi:hypothetical protein